MEGIVGRFHCVISLVLIALAGLVLLVKAARHHTAPPDIAHVPVLLAATAVISR